MNEYMQLAIQQAREGMTNGHGGPFGAVLVKDGEVISKSHNTVIKEKDSTCHAEMNVIREASKKFNNFNLEGCEIYTTGRPCKMCEAATSWAKIKKVYYGNTYEDALTAGFNDETSNNLGLELIRIDENETKKLLNEWENIENKVLY
jgi:guanine deaminase